MSTWINCNWEKKHVIGVEGLGEIGIAAAVFLIFLLVMCDDRNKRWIVSSIRRNGGDIKEKMRVGANSS